MFQNLFKNFTESFTSCTQITTGFADCTNAKITDTSSPCYWNSEIKKCGSFKDSGYCGKDNEKCVDDIDSDSSTSVEDTNSTILNDIQSLQAIEQQLFNSLEENTGLTTDQKNLIIEKINDISKMRLNLYLTLGGVNTFYQHALTNTKDTLVEQTETISIIETELNSAKQRLMALEEEKNNKIRLVEINNYYGQKYEEHSHLMKILVAMLVPILVLSLLLRKGIFSSEIYYILVAIIAVIGGIFLSRVLSSALTRDDMNYQAYNWSFDRSSAPKNTSTTKVDPWASISSGITGGMGLTCVGDACCTNGLTYDTTNNVCVLSSDATSASTTTSKSGYFHFTKPESFVNYNAF